MEEGLRFSFDKEADMLDISIGTPKKAISREVDDDFFVRNAFFFNNFQCFLSAILSPLSKVKIISPKRCGVKDFCYD